MNRRSFFSKLSSAIVGCYLAVGVEFKGKIEDSTKARINPAWENADYGITFVGHDVWLELMNQTEWKAGMGSVMRGVK